MWHSSIRGLAALLLASFLLAACAAEGPKVAEVAEANAGPPPGKGRIFFYRMELPLFFALDPQIVVNSRAVGRSVHGEAFYRDAYPGRYSAYLANDPDDRLDFTVADGETVYVKTDIYYGISSDRLTLKLMDEETARAELADEVLVDPAKRTVEAD